MGLFRWVFHLIQDLKMHHAKKWGEAWLLTSVSPTVVAFVRTRTLVPRLARYMWALGSEGLARVVVNQPSWLPNDLYADRAL